LRALKFACRVTGANTELYYMTRPHDHDDADTDEGLGDLSWQWGRLTETERELVRLSIEAIADGYLEDDMDWSRYQGAVFGQLREGVRNAQQVHRVALVLARAI